MSIIWQFEDSNCSALMFSASCSKFPCLTRRDDISLRPRLVKKKKKSCFLFRKPSHVYLLFSNKFLSEWVREGWFLFWYFIQFRVSLKGGRWCHLWIVLERSWHLNSEDLGPTWPHTWVCEHWPITFKVWPLFFSSVNEGKEVCLFCKSFLEWGRVRHNENIFPTRMSWILHATLHKSQIAVYMLVTFLQIQFSGVTDHPRRLPTNIHSDKQWDILIWSRKKLKVFLWASEHSSPCCLF